MWPHRRSPHQAQTACRTVCIVYPRLPRVPIPHVHRFSTGLGHMHGGSDSTNFSPSQSSRSAHVACTVVLHADLQLLRRVLDFIFGTMKHSCHSAVSLSIADGGTDLSTASVTNPATAFDFSAASPPVIACRSSSCLAMHFFSKSRYSKHFPLHILTLFVIGGCAFSFSAHTLSSTSCLPSKLCLSLRATCCNSKSRLLRARGQSRGAVAHLSCSASCSAFPMI